METIQGRKQRRQLVMQSLRLMMLSGVVRPAAIDPPYLAVPKAPPPQPQAEQSAPAGSTGSIGRVVIGLLAFITVSIWSGTPAEAVQPVAEPLEQGHAAVVADPDQPLARRDLVLARLALHPLEDAHPLRPSIFLA